MEANDFFLAQMDKDAAWIFDTYHDDDDKLERGRMNDIRQRLRAIATRHRHAAQLLKAYRNAT